MEKREFVKFVIDMHNQICTEWGGCQNRCDRITALVKVIDPTAETKISSPIIDDCSTGCMEVSWSDEPWSDDFLL